MSCPACPPEVRRLVAATAQLRFAFRQGEPAPLQQALRAAQRALAAYHGWRRRHQGHTVVAELQTLHELLPQLFRCRNPNTLPALWANLEDALDAALRILHLHRMHLTQPAPVGRRSHP